MSTSQKERAALAALELVRDGMTIGLGTGSTAAFFIEGLGRKIREEGLEIEAIPTSQASDALARKAGIELIIPDETTVIDLDVDGADEVSAEGHLIKGGGAALLREKIIARAAKQFVVIADESKSVTELGAFPLPIEIEQFGFALTVRALRDMLAGEGHEGVELSLRHNEEGGFVLSDGGNFIVDAKLGRIREPVALESALNMIPGVVDCGLFIGMADQVIIGTADGIETRRYQFPPRRPGRPVMTDTPKTPFEELKAAIHDYGEAAMENLVRCRALGHAISDGFLEYLGVTEDCVSLVPPHGPFDPRKDYGDKAFSFSEAPVIRLEPIVFGLCITVPHEEDSGKLWLRVIIKMAVSGGVFDVFAGHQPLIRVPLNFEGALKPVYDAIKEELLSVFAQELAVFNDSRYAEGIGFVPPEK